VRYQLTVHTLENFLEIKIAKEKLELEKVASEGDQELLKGLNLGYESYLINDL